MAAQGWRGGLTKISTLCFALASLAPFPLPVFSDVGRHAQRSRSATSSRSHRPDEDRKWVSTWCRDRRQPAGARKAAATATNVVPIATAVHRAILVQFHQSSRGGLLAA